VIPLAGFDALDSAPSGTIVTVARLLRQELRMIRFFTLLVFALLALLVALDSSIFSGVATMIVGLSAFALTVSLFSDLSRDT
jgi:hypothetical protein